MAVNNASEMWWRAFCHMGCLVTDCRCGRTHFATGDFNGGYEHGELEELREKQAKHPDRFFENAADDSISVSTLGLVWNCPCGESAKHEEYLLQHQHEILSFYKALLEAQQSETQELADALKSAEAIPPMRSL